MSPRIFRLLFSDQTAREAYSDLDIDILVAHRYLQSIYNITIERGWLRLRIEWGDNVRVIWENGNGLFDPMNSADKYVIS